MPKAIKIAAVTAAASAGMEKLRFRLSNEVLRQASSGPTAVSKSSSRATGTLTRLKKGGPTVTLWPCTHSESTGKSVPQSTVKQATNRTRLLKRKLDSREMSDSSRFSLCRCDRFFTKAATQTAKVSARNPTNQLPMEDCAKACTELTRPLRVRKVPKMQSRKVAKISHMFQIFSMPRFSCIITECRNAVPVSQGMREAFSTGSQAQ